MTKLNGYRLSTAILALLFAAVLIRDLARPEPERTSPGHRTEGGVIGPSAPAPADPSATDGHGVAAADPDTPDLQDEPDPEPSREEPVYDLAVRLILSRKPYSPDDWKMLRETLGPRKAELVPLLEGWLRRREELRREGIHLENAAHAYAVLAGEAAIPLLQEIHESQQGAWVIATRALHWVDSPKALDLLARYQAAEPPKHYIVDLFKMWRGPDRFRTAVRDWTTRPPAGAEWLAEECRYRVFRYGTMEDREAVWGLLTPLQRLRLLRGGNARKWGGEWPRRLVTSVTEGLEHDDPEVRYRAVHRVLADSEILGAQFVAAAERVLDADRASAAADMASWSGSNLETLNSLKSEFEGRRRQLEFERRRWELLAPR